MTDQITLPVAFGAGVLSFLSPCILPLIPVYLGVIGGSRIYNIEPKRIYYPLFFHSIMFVLGFSLVFASLGALAGLTGLFIDNYLLNRIAGGLLIFFGVFIVAARKISWLNIEKRVHASPLKATGYARSFIVGAVFSLGWTACVGPILGGILAIAAVRSTAWQGAYLLAIYSLGLGLPFLVMGLGFSSLMPLIRKINVYSSVLNITSACLLVAVGVLILTDRLVLISALAA